MKNAKTYTKTDMGTVMTVLENISKTASQARELAKRRHKSIDWALSQVISDNCVDAVEKPEKALGGFIAADIVRKLKARSGEYSEALEKYEKRAAEIRSL